MLKTPEAASQGSRLQNIFCSVGEPRQPIWDVRFDLTSGNLTSPGLTTWCKTTGSNYKVMRSTELKKTHRYLWLSIAHIKADFLCEHIVLPSNKEKQWILLHIVQLPF